MRRTIECSSTVGDYLRRAESTWPRGAQASAYCTKAEDQAGMHALSEKQSDIQRITAAASPSYHMRVIGALDAVAERNDCYECPHPPNQHYLSLLQAVSNEEPLPREYKYHLRAHDDIGIAAPLFSTSLAPSRSFSARTFFKPRTDVHSRRADVSAPGVLRREGRDFAGTGGRSVHDIMAAVAPGAGAHQSDRMFKPRMICSVTLPAA
ncbi:unnamed protein product [Pleuronectes platessa]|uniref:Uncharacterized protein n=1 Tax=Pleuronectes platessa TaxID=8262 RepID=A0A9N7Z323_PLEPL|nr:unnamed protein product [Pleuronectes platessa]